MVVLILTTYVSKGQGPDCSKIGTGCTPSFKSTSILPDEAFYNCKKSRELDPLLDKTGFIEYKWTTPDGQTINKTNISVDIPGTYTLCYDTAGGTCPKQDQVKVIKDERKFANIDFKEVTACSKTPYPLTIGPTQPGYTYIWGPSNSSFYAGNDPKKTNIYFEHLQPTTGTYRLHLHAKDPLECLDTSYFKLIIQPTPVLRILKLKSNYCVGEQTLIKLLVYESTVATPNSTKKIISTFSIDGVEQKLEAPQDTQITKPLPYFGNSPYTFKMYNFLLTPIKSGPNNLKFTVKNELGCTQTLDSTIQVNLPSSNITVNGPTISEFCNNEPIFPLSAVTGAGTPATSGTFSVYPTSKAVDKDANNNWFFDASKAALGENIITYTEPKSSTTTCGAAGRDTVKVFPIPTPKIIGRTSVCPGSTDVEYKDTATFPGYSVTRDWVPTAGGPGFSVAQVLNTANDSVSVDFPTTPGLATLTLTNILKFSANGKCDAPPTAIDIIINKKLKPKSPNGPSVICTGADSVLYSAEFGSNYYHKWFIRGGGMNNKTYSLKQGSKVLWYPGAPEYWLWVRDSSAIQGDCSGNSDTLKIKFTEDPYANFLVPFGGKDTTVCKGIEFTLKADPAGGEIFFWKSNHKTETILGHEWKVKPDKTTNYTLTVGKGMACSDKEDTITVSVKDLPGDPLPQPDFSTCFEEVSETAIIAKKDNPSNTVIWENNPLFTDVAYKISNPGTYSVVQKDTYGCPMAGTITVKDNCPVRIYVPQAFTPNGDTKNDSLMVFGNDRYETFHFRIFDRWGEILFSTNNRNEKWGGNFYNGKIVPNGVYPWIVTYETISEDKKRESFTQNGSITLIR